MYTLGDIASARAAERGALEGLLSRAVSRSDGHARPPARPNRDVNIGGLDAPKASDLEEHRSRSDNLRAVELRQLESFLAVVEEGQFARAARRLFLSPSAVTGHLHQLEREIGARLLQRSPVSLTLAGERLLPHARKMIAAAKSAADSVKDLSDDRARALRVGVMAPGSAELTAAVLRTFGTAQPEIHLSVHSLSFVDFASALSEHRVDVAFLRPALHDERTTTDILTCEPRIILAPAHGDLADADELALEDILDRPFVRFPEPTPSAFADYGCFASARNGTPPHWCTEQAGTMQELMISIAAGWGIAGTLASLGRFYRSPDICCRPLPDAPWEATALVSRRNDPRPEVQAFRSVALTLARDLGPGLVPRRTA